MQHELQGCATDYLRPSPRQRPPLIESERMTFPGSAANEDGREVVLVKVGCLFLDRREVQRTVGVKGAMRGHDQTVERVGGFQWHVVDQEAFFSVSRGRIKRTSTAETAATLAKLQK